MASENYNFINPVDSLQNIPSLTPIQKNDERKNRQNSQQQRNTHDTADEQSQEPAQSQSVEPNDDSHSIDYCA